MRKWNVEPLICVDKIKFGIHRNTIRLLLEEPCREFKKNELAEVTTDDYGYCHIYYDSENKCVAVEIFSDIQLFIQGNLIFPGRIDNFKEQFSDLVVIGDVYISKEYSIGLYAPEGVIESVLVGKQNYYSLV